MLRGVDGQHLDQFDVIECDNPLFLARIHLVLTRPGSVQGPHRRGAKLGPPPRVPWLTIGNISNACVQEVFLANWTQIASHSAAGEPLVEVQGSARRS